MILRSTSGTRRYDLGSVPELVASAVIITMIAIIRSVQRDIGLICELGSVCSATVG